jgi:hypothetical protein
MRTRKAAATLASALAFGLIVAGCGDSDETSTVTIAPGTSTSTDTTSSSGASPESVYNDCIDAIEGTPAESTGQTTCRQTRDVLEQCVQQAQSLPQAAQASAIQICESAAQQAIDGLRAAG